jgi:hypothetical protein
LKYITLIALLFITLSVVGQLPFKSELRKYNEGLELVILRNGESLTKSDAIGALIIVINNDSIDSAKISIGNNPQLKEIQIYNGNQELLNYIASLQLPNLTHLFYNDFNYPTLDVPKLPTIEHLKIQSSTLVSLNMTNAQLDKLDILDIELPNLTTWKTDKEFPSLGLIELKAPKLNYFPIEQMPQIVQFSYHCSLTSLPLNLCSYPDLNYISFENYGPIKIDSCFKKKVKSSVWSNITVYDKQFGKKIREILSKDRQKGRRI